MRRLGGELVSGIEEMLEVRDIHTYYGDSYVLQGVSLRVERGTVVAVLGRNGMGKTTLMRSIIGFTPPRRGQLWFKGVDITGMPAHRIARLGMGIIPQGRRIFPSLSVRENLEIAARPRRAPGDKQAGWTLARVFGLFPRLQERLLQPGGALSGGEQQMLASARALIGNPDFLLLDEPTEGLAPLLVRELGGVIRQLKEEGLSILLVEQNLPFALQLADYVYIMSKGRIVYEAPPHALAQNEEVKARHLGI
jgi:branched-chain amino acid transport system ATP-binding protein